MVKIINGKKYNTDTAEEVGSWWNGLGWSDFHAAQETLYRKRTGEFFLHGEGGAATQYAEPCGDMWGAGEKIIPLSVEKAKEWAEKNLSVEKYEEIFGTVSEGDDDTTKTFNTTISTSSYTKLKELAAKSGRPMGAMIDDLIKSAQ